MKKKIAVIGAGIFGVSIALELSKEHQVVLFEKEDSILEKASLNNHFRHHMGYHYPRSKETAYQSIKGMKSFEREYGKCLLKSFPNFYSITKRNSLTTPKQYLKFCKDMGLPYKIVNPDPELINPDVVSLTLKVPERAFDPSKLKEICEKKLKKSDVDLRLKEKIIGGNLKDKIKTLKVHKEVDVYEEEFDYVINSTYANSNEFLEMFGFPSEELQYELMELVELEIKGDLFGCINMDGSFTSLLPKGDNGIYTLAHVEESVNKRIIKKGFPGEVTDFGKIKSNSKSILDKSTKHFPILKKAKVIGSQYIVKVVKSNVDDTDERISEIKTLSQGVYSVFSGKVVTCIDIAKRIRTMIKKDIANQKNLRILIINDHLKYLGGAEGFVYSLKSVLEKQGHEVRLLGSERGEDLSSLFSRLYSFKWYKKTVDKLKEFKPDVVHINNCSRVISPSVIDACIKNNIPSVMTFHDLSFVCPRSGGIYDKNMSKKTKFKHKCYFDGCLGYKEGVKDYLRNLWRGIKLLVHRKVIKKNNVLYVAQSRFLSRALEKSLKIKVRVINNGMNVPSKKTTYNDEILYVGQINKEKGLPTIANVLNKIKKYEAIALGRGPLKENLESKYKNIAFKGFKKPTEYYEKASISVVPSIWCDTFPLSVLEAMSYGLCVIASKIGGIPEQIKDMETGVLFEPGNEREFEKKLNYLLENPKEIKRMGGNAREFVKENLSWEKIVKKYEKAYQEAMERKN